ncbi:MAG: cob(I)yrinic acid a,c-diamide adenosyltransferase [Ignavibacteriaceae bacterium]
MAKIYTKTGDNGETGIFGGSRVPKYSILIDAYGTIDELNSFIGLAVTEVRDADVEALLEKIQDELFIVGSNLSLPEHETGKQSLIPQVTDLFITDTELAIDKYEEKLEPLKNFILPGGSKGAALLHTCRTICRRAERKVVQLKSKENVNDNIVIFLNRLSDLFFVLARHENMISNVPDIKWNTKT